MSGHATNLLKLILVLAIFSVANGEVRLPAIISDNMVLQQGVKVRIWGNAKPSERVTVTLKDKSASTVADAQGRWQAWLDPSKAGGPFELTVKGDNVVTIKNVLVGEVWLCSGQSNMEWPLVNTTGGAETVAQANYPEIRLFTVTKNTSSTPLADVEGHWLITTPDDAAHFSAVGYFFGRELYQQLKVPIGLIHSSWGGTPAEAWTRHDALLSSPELKPILDKYESSLNALPQAKEAYARALAAWEEKNLYIDGGNKGEALGYADPATSTADWSRMDLPKQFETAGLLIDGAVWFRKDVELPASWSGKDLVLNLPPIDDQDVTYFNGTKVGSTGRDTPNSYMVPRKYVVPGSLVRAGRNVIAVRVFDSAGEGGFSRGGAFSIGPTESEPLTLRGVWDYKIEQALEPKHPDWGSRPEAIGVSNQNNPSVLYNAMIAPLVNVAIRGVIWYQGESNAGRAYQYRTLFPTMIRDWRSAWGNNFPFYFVQLANWHANKAEPDESDWAELREAQMMTLREPQTGMAVTIDIGDENDIHPRNKLDVGRRLAAWALADTYKQKVIPSGPLFDRFTIEGNEVRIRFKYADGLKTIDGGPLKGFALAGEDRHFVWADARIEGDTVIVSSPKISKPVAVRYAWADNPIANLYNKAGLPASPFRTDDWPGITAGRY
ncbi:MAG TPA: sialate O-acetylesterase [Pyrinomonadaceae bacterium]|jgi:sialate O-acetylesterase|nr:sialate O-acetylesterase [Pyrinomonadaceae bacterium]